MPLLLSPLGSKALEASWFTFSVTVPQLSWSFRDTFRQACACQLWLICATYDITLGVGHVPGDTLLQSADALSCWYIGQL